MLIYYAGHGIHDDAAAEGYWLPMDAAIADPTNRISNGDIAGMLRPIRARHLMVVADSCYSGALVHAARRRIAPHGCAGWW